MIDTLMSEHGALAMGWVAAIVLFGAMVKLYRDNRQASIRHMADYKELALASQEALRNNTEVMTAIKVRLEERSRLNE